jgi:hypothetical protein
MKENMETFIGASKEVGLGVNAEKNEVHVAVSSPGYGAKSLHEDSK